MKKSFDLSLLTDLYELTMMQGYFFNAPGLKGVFDMFFRKMPFQGGYSVFAGLEDAIQAILNIRFSDQQIDYLNSLHLFEKKFLQFLKTFAFTGDIYALKEGTVVFPNEPLIRVEGNIIQTQLIESMLLNFINFQSLIATKASRIALAAEGDAILEFGLRRAQGVDGSLSASRAAFIGGAQATSNVLAGQMYDIPVKGTMAHSWVMSFDNEFDAFEKYAVMYPDQCILLVDTFDTLKSGIPNAIKVFKKMKARGIKNYGIRLDSGDLEYLSKEARKMFDTSDLKETKIFASNELDEWIISQLKQNKSPIDAWGVGTRLVTGEGEGALSGVYKIVAKDEGRGFTACIKISNNPEKISNPGIKNIYRFYDKEGMAIADLVFLQEEEKKLTAKIKARQPIRFNHPSIDYACFILEDYSHAVKLLEPYVLKGKKVKNSTSLKDIQILAGKEVDGLHPTFKRLLNPHIYKVSISDDLKELKGTLVKKYCDPCHY
ncbi:MAG: nicotinate phosphoribosyltransferase [Spirochaetes bacterium]|nr:nicotinate phosphoribosyltransferase [Spirochaetota bacterium]